MLFRKYTLHYGENNESQCPIVHAATSAANLECEPL
jgi:hypothetical protein